MVFLVDDMRMMDSHLQKDKIDSMPLTVHQNQLQMEQT